MLNRVSLQGRLTRNPEVRLTQNQNSVASFTLACEGDYADDQGHRNADFIDCVAWKKTAEFVGKYFTRGQMAIVDGRLSKRQYTTQDGDKRYVTEVVVSNIYFCGPKQENGNQGGAAAYSPTGYNAPAPPQPQPSQTSFAYGVSQDEDEDELPF